jgi:2-keto-4-pentenoate hydratase/2-oxohepta-3-ene-1,7-dioic acid hydratase in catechol pathway
MLNRLLNRFMAGCASRLRNDEAGPARILTQRFGRRVGPDRSRQPGHFGQPNGGEMHFGFCQLIAHAALTRKLGAGAIIGSGTVSNADRTAGPACIAEQRVVEIIEHGAARTAYMRFGDTVRMGAVTPDGGRPFGTIEQRVVPQRRMASGDVRAGSVIASTTFG